jgi:hypothetical protein
LDFLVQPGKANKNNVSIQTTNGGFIQATIDADFSFVLDELNQTAGTMNIYGDVYIQILPLINSLRLYLSDYNLVNISQVNSTSIDANAAFTLIDVLGQFGFAYANFELGSHVIVLQPYN